MTHYQRSKERKELVLACIKSLSASQQLLSTLLEEIEAADKLLEAREKLLLSTVACPLHGEGCVPHSINWLAAVKAAMQEFVDRGDKGEVRSTYAKFKKLLAGDIPQ